MTRGSEFGVFAGAPCVRYFVAPKAFSRAELARLEEVAKEWGAKGLAYIVVDESGEVPLADREVPLRGRARRVRGRARLDGPLRRRRARSSSRACSAACACISAASSASLRPEQDVFHWVLDFPLFERDEDTGGWTFLHHPFTAPMPGQEEWDEHDPAGDPGPALRPDLERLGARLRLDPGPRRRAAAARVPHDGPLRRGGRSRSSASCSRRSRWARRRTAASRWGSSASSR